MNIEVQFFSRLRDLAGQPPNSTSTCPRVRNGRRTCSRCSTSSIPAMRPWDAHLLIAVGLDYAARDQVLHAGESVSIMPPVQGG